MDPIGVILLFAVCILYAIFITLIMMIIQVVWFFPGLLFKNPFWPVRWLRNHYPKIWDQLTMKNLDNH